MQELHQLVGKCRGFTFLDMRQGGRNGHSPFLIWVSASDCLVIHVKINKVKQIIIRAVTAGFCGIRGKKICN